MNTHKKHAAEFDEFVRRQQVDQSEDEGAFWDSERDEWLLYLDRLYSTVEKYLKPYVDGGTIQISRREISLNEENIGQYQANEMVIRIGRQEVVFKPIGTLLIGTKGRVDVEGAAGKARLVLTDKNATKPEIRVTIKRGDRVSSSAKEPVTAVDWTWKIATNPPQISYLELSEAALFDLVMEVSNG